nr:MAG TPA: hypothetical protein [Caudoviricetes sp.]
MDYIHIQEKIQLCLQLLGLYRILRKNHYGLLMNLVYLE